MHRVLQTRMLLHAVSHLPPDATLPHFTIGGTAVALLGCSGSTADRSHLRRGRKTTLGTLPNRHDIDALSELGEVMATSHDSKRKLDARKSDKLPDLESVLRKQEMIALVGLLILVGIFALVIGLQA